MLGDSVEVTDSYGIWWSYIPHFIARAGLRLRVLVRLPVLARDLPALPRRGRVARRALCSTCCARAGSAPPAELASPARARGRRGGPLLVHSDPSDTVSETRPSSSPPSWTSASLIVGAATERGASRPVDGVQTLVCGIGPVEAAATTARALAAARPGGARCCTSGSPAPAGWPRSRSCSAPRRSTRTPRARSSRARTRTQTLLCSRASTTPSRTPSSGRSGRARQASRPGGRRRRSDGSLRRAPRHASSPGSEKAVEIRVIANEIDELERTRWRFDDAFAATGGADAAARRGSVRRVTREPLPPPLPPETRTIGQLVGESIKIYRARTSGGSLALPGAGIVAVNQIFGRSRHARPGWAILAAGAPAA